MAKNLYVCSDGRAPGATLVLDKTTISVTLNTSLVPFTTNEIVMGPYLGNKIRIDLPNFCGINLLHYFVRDKGLLLVSPKNESASIEMSYVLD